MKLSKEIIKILEENTLELDYTYYKDDFYTCTLKRPSGFSLFKEDVRRDMVNDWIFEKIEFIKGKNKWVK